MKILIMEPFYTGSHKAWCDQLKTHIDAEVQLLTLAGRHWKWRMRGAAVTLAYEYDQLDYQPDLIIASDMLDLATFIALSRKKIATTKTVLYFHENQITYFWSQNDLQSPFQQDVNFGLINIHSALAADQVIFNSEFHRKSFLGALPKFLGQFPDYNNLNVISEIKTKSQVLHLGLDLKEQPLKQRRDHVLLFNHRWEYDKNPEQFFHIVETLATEGFEFKLLVLGQSFRKEPKIFAEAKAKFKERILQFGFIASKKDYIKLLNQATLLPVTSQQDFFGISVVEATYYGAIPLCPDRLSYTELLPAKNIYENEADLLTKLRQYLSKPYKADYDLVEEMSLYSWPNQKNKYRACFEAILSAE